MGWGRRGSELVVGRLAPSRSKRVHTSTTLPMRQCGGSQYRLPAPVSLPLLSRHYSTAPPSPKRYKVESSRTRKAREEEPAGAGHGGIPRTGLHMDDATRICRVGSGLVRHGVKAYGREVVSFARSVRPSQFVNLLTNLVLHFGRKDPQDGRGGGRRIGDITPVGIPVGEWPAKGNLLYLGLCEAGTHHQLSDVPRIGHGEGAGRIRVRRRNMSL